MALWDVRGHKKATIDVLLFVPLKWYMEQSGLGARNTYSIICSCKIGDCCCSIEVSYVVYIH
jgi:hypothetical protein